MKPGVAVITSFLLACGAAYALWHLMPTTNYLTIALGRKFSAKLQLEAHFAEAQPHVPMLLIDTTVLTALSADRYWPFVDPVKVAVDKRWMHLPVAEKEEFFEIIFYEKPDDADYWIFIDSDGTKRAMLPFNITNTSSYSYPTRIEYFLQDWEYSRFMTCLTQAQSTESVDEISHLVTELSDLRDFSKSRGRNAHLIAAGSTLHSWWNRCAIAPHKDADFFIRSEELSLQLLSSFADNKSSYAVSNVSGKRNLWHNFDISIRRSSSGTIHITSQSCEYEDDKMVDNHSQEKSYTRSNQFCTGDLYGHLIYVPCNVELFVKRAHINGKSGDLRPMMRFHRRSPLLFKYERQQLNKVWKQ